VPRKGLLHRLPVQTKDFRHVISTKARWPAHSSVLEAHGLALTIRWHSRRVHTHHHRLPLLVDARAIIGAATRGRTSSRALRGVLRSYAAVCLAADYLPRLVYIPSESNPSDAPSRGLRRHRQDADRRRARNKHSRFGAPWERKLARQVENIEFLFATGAFEDVESDSCSTGSATHI
jgi:hypothetical protein